MSIYECPQKIGRGNISILTTLNPSVDISCQKIQCIKELRTVVRQQREGVDTDGYPYEVDDFLGLLAAKLSCDHLFEDPIKNCTRIHIDSDMIKKTQIQFLLISSGIVWHFF